MKTLNYLWAITLIITLFTNCQKREDEEVKSEKVFEDKILLGLWTGTLRQPGYLPVIVEANILKLEINKKAGNVIGQDYCSTDLTYLDKIGISFLFKEDLVPGLNLNCIGGTSSINIKSKDTINYNWVGEDDPRNNASAVLVRKK